MSLTKEQLAFRSRVVGGSDANIIMGGDAEKVIRLWREKRGEIEREDLSGVLPVRMGSYTEPFNIQWFEEQTGRIVTHQGDERLSIDEPFMACTLDGLTDDGKTVFEAKHVSAFAKDNEIRARYYPQLQHNMAVCGLDNSVLSVFFGTFKWEASAIPADPMYQIQLIEAERQFWHCVTSGAPPIAVAVAAPVDAIRKVDFTGNNAWAACAVDWIENQSGAKKFEKAAKTLKEMIDADVIEASGHGIVASRNKAGSVSIKLEK